METVRNPRRCNFATFDQVKFISIHEKNLRSFFSAGSWQIFKSVLVAISKVTTKLHNAHILKVHVHHLIKVLKVLLAGLIYIMVGRRGSRFLG